MIQAFVVVSLVAWMSWIFFRPPSSGVLSALFLALMGLILLGATFQTRLRRRMFTRTLELLHEVRVAEAGAVAEGAVSESSVAT